MTIRSATSSIHGSGCHASRANIERQIRRLEKQKERLIEKLGAGDESSEQDTAALSLGNLTIGGQKPAGEAGSIGAGLGQALRSFSQSLFEPPVFPEAEDEEREKKKIIEKIQLIEMQIMTLKKQLGDYDAPDVKLIEKSIENAADTAPAATVAQIAATLSADDSATVCVDEGQVDTYA